MTFGARSIPGQQPSSTQRFLTRNRRLPKELRVTKFRREIRGSLTSSLHSAISARQTPDDDNDPQSDGDSSDNDRDRGTTRPSNNAGFGNNPNIVIAGTVGTTNSNAANRRPGPKQDQDQDGDDGTDDTAARVPQRPGVAFVTLTATRTEFITVPAPTSTAAGTVTATVILTVNNYPINGPDGPPRNSFPDTSIRTAFPTTTPSDSNSETRDGRVQLSSGSIAAIAIGVIIFVALIMAFVIRMVHLRRERPWTQLDRGLCRFPDEEKLDGFGYRSRYQPENTSQTSLPSQMTDYQPTLPARALRRPTVRFATRPTEPSTIDEDLGSDISSLDDKLYTTTLFTPSNIHTNGTDRPPVGILLNPLPPTSNS
ncbi:hypothetical protein CVT24_009368 [Panaeolus cyanescens]|uniref:Uncharacterized protein n=1 Tax=Panaeolus cyanescens TaxID=181874 RepID=A0A409Y7U9_9AGAR|nr:hypothetical protein CVT24_009368 [Panaeolus cyanescens]